MRIHVVGVATPRLNFVGQHDVLLWSTPSVYIVLGTTSKKAKSIVMNALPKLSQKLVERVTAEDRKLAKTKGYKVAVRGTTHRDKLYKIRGKDEND